MWQSVNTSATQQIERSSRYIFLRQFILPRVFDILYFYAYLLL